MKTPSRALVGNFLPTVTIEAPPGTCFVIGASRKVLDVYRDEDPGQQWRQVPFHDGGHSSYEVNMLGDIRRTHTQNGTELDESAREDRVLSPSVKPDGYRYVVLYIEGKRREVGVAWAVMAAWVGPRPVLNGVKMDVDHVDADPANNAIDNLQYVTRSENMYRRVTKKGGRCTIPDSLVLTLRDLYWAKGRTTRQLVKMFGEIPASTLKKIVYGQTRVKAGFPDGLSLEQWKERRRLQKAVDAAPAPEVPTGPSEAGVEDLVKRDSAL